ncbi:MAG: insulinase family protein [Crocinitomix sp.]|nr:insulinase family protein [Crocinitomix sp.]
MKKLILILSIILTSNLFAQLDRSIVPDAQPNPEIKIEIPEPLTFGNGLKVIMVENHKLPKVSFQLYVDYPNEMEGDIAGVSSIFGELLGSGTQRTPKDVFDEKIDYMGATFSTYARGFYASSLKKHTPKLLHLVNEVLMGPAFPQEEFDRIVAQSESSLAAIASDAGTMSNNVSSVVNYGANHPYGEVMTETTLANITLEDVKEYHQRFFIPNHAYLVIVGDITKDEVKSYVNEYFSTWKKGEALNSTDFAVPPAKGKNVYFVNKPGAVQSVINITHTVELTPGHEDEIKLKVLNQILGGGSFSARLLSNLREDKAYTYGCYSSISSNQLIGSFTAGGNFRNEVTDSAVVQILAEIVRISDVEVLDTELDLVKKSMTGAFARSLENPQTVARFALNTVRYNLPSDYYATYLQKLERVTKQELILAASEYLSPENLNIVVVGNEDIAEKLAGFDVDGKVAYKNYYGEDVERLKDVESGVTAESIFKNYYMKTLMASNDEEIASKLKAAQQIETISKAELKAYSATILMYSAEAASNKTAAYLLIKSPMGNQVGQKEWFDGTQGGNVAGPVVTVYEGEELEDKKKPNYPVNQIYYKDDATVTVTLMGISTVEDVDYYKIKIVDEESTVLEFYDVKTGMLMMSETYGTNDKDEPTTVIVKFDNYEEYSGLYLPKNTSINNEGQLFEFEVISRKISKKIKSKAFTGNFKKVDKVLGKL